MGYLAGGGPNLFNVRVPKIVDGARISRHFLEIFVEPLKVARRLVACAVLVTAFVLLHLEVWWRYFIYLSLSFYFSTYLGGGIHLFLLFQYFTFVTDESLVHTLPWLLRNLKNTSTSVRDSQKKKRIVTDESLVHTLPRYLGNVEALVSPPLNFRPGNVAVNPVHVPYLIGIVTYD